MSVRCSAGDGCGCNLRAQAAPAAKESANGHARGEDDCCERSTNDGRTEEDVEHLHAVSPAAAVDEAIGIVGAREFLALWDWHFQEVAERLPALAHLVFKQVLFRYQRAHLIVVFLESSLAVLLEVALPELGPEFC